MNYVMNKVALVPIQLNISQLQNFITNLFVNQAKIAPVTNIAKNNKNKRIDSVSGGGEYPVG